MATFTPAGQGTVRDAAGNAVGNRGQDFDRTYYNRNKDSGSPNSSTNQVAQRVLDFERNPDGTYRPVVSNPEGSGRDPARMNPVFARRLQQLNYAPDFEGYVSRGENTETYIDSEGRQRVVQTGAAVDTGGWTRVDRESYENQQRSDFRPNPGRVNSLGYAVSENPNDVAYLGADGNLIITSRNRLPESANIVFNADGTLSERSVNRLDPYINDRTGQIAPDAEISYYDRDILERQYTEEAERAAGLRVNAQSREDLELNQRFAAAERRMEAADMAMTAARIGGSFAAGGLPALAGSVVGSVVGAEAAERYGPGAVEAAQRLRESGNRYIQENWWAPIKQEEQDSWIQERGINVPGPSREEAIQLNQNMVAVINSTVPGNYTQFNQQAQERGQNVQTFSESLFDTVRDDPIGIAAETGAFYVLGAGIGGLAGGAVNLAARSARAGPIVNAAVRGTGLASQGYDYYDAYLYSTGRYFDLMDPGVKEMVPGVTYEFGTPESLNLLGEWLAQNVGANAAGDRGFDRTYREIPSGSLLNGKALDDAIIVDNIRADVMAGTANQNLVNMYQLEDLVRMNEEIRNLSYDMIGPRSRGEDISQMERRYNVLRSRRDTSADQFQQRLMQDIRRGFDPEEMALNVGSDRFFVQSAQQPDLSQRTMDVIGGDINEPELRPGRGRQDELPVGRGRQMDELVVGDGYGNVTQIFPGSDLFGFDRLIDSSADYARQFYNNRRVRYGNEYGNIEEYGNAYDYSSDPDFSNAIRRLTDFGYDGRFRNQNQYRYTEENDYGYQNRNDFGFRFDDVFNFRNVEDFGFRMDMPRIRIPEFDPELMEPNERRVAGSKSRRTREQRNRNPFLDLAELGRLF